MGIRAWMGARLLALGLLLGALVPAVAVERQALESSLVVSGEITVGPDGAVREYRLDPKAPIGQDVRGYLDGLIRGWQFAPVQQAGAPVGVRAPMRLRLVARALDAEGKRYGVRLASAWFGAAKDSDGAGSGGNGLAARQMTPPTYPEQALQAGYAGTVYLLLRVDASGVPQDVATEQVDLYTVGDDPREVQKMQRVLARAAESGARHWRLAVSPALGPGPHIVRIPVDFVLRGEASSELGQWRTYLPGPRNRDIPWAREPLQAAGSPGAEPPNAISLLGGGGPHLRTPVEG